jgi:hypothetical protein
MSDIGVESLAGAIRSAASLSPETIAKNMTDNNIPHNWSESLDGALGKIDDYLTRTKE